MLIEFRHFFSVLLCQSGLSRYASIIFVAISCSDWVLFSWIFSLSNIFYCQISTKFLKPDKKTADLVGNEKMKASTNVRHIVLPCSSSARAQLIPDIIRCYSR